MRFFGKTRCEICGDTADAEPVHIGFNVYRFCRECKRDVFWGMKQLKEEAESAGA